MLNWLKKGMWSSTQPAHVVLSGQEVGDLKALAYLVPRKFEGLEVWLLLFCGAYGLAVTMLVIQGSREIALCCVGFLCLAVWRRFNPARNRSSWLTSAAAVFALVCLIYINPVSGGASGPYLFLILLMAITYPLLMDPPELLIFAGSLLVLYLASGRQSASAIGLPPALFILRGALILGVCGLSGRFGKVLRQSEQRTDTLRRDKASLAYNEHGLLRYGGRLLSLCGEEAQPCTLVLLPMPTDWHAPLGLGGPSSASSALHAQQLRNRALRDMALHLSLCLPAEAVVSRNAQGDWVVLVPWLERQAVLNTIEHTFGRPLQLPFGARKDEMFVALSPCLVASSGSSDTVQGMLARAQDIWERAVRSGVVDAAG